MPKVRKAVITAAGRGTRQYPASSAVQKEMFPLVDRDGLTKPVIQIIGEEAIESGIEEICIITQPGEEQQYRDYFKRLDNDTVKAFRGKDWAILESEKLGSFGERLSFAEQHAPEGFGHAVYVVPCTTDRSMPARDIDLDAGAPGGDDLAGRDHDAESAFAVRTGRHPVARWIGDRSQPGRVRRRHIAVGADPGRVVADGTGGAADVPVAGRIMGVVRCDGAEEVLLRVKCLRADSGGIPHLCRVRRVVGADPGPGMRQGGGVGPRIMRTCVPADEVGRKQPSELPPSG